MNSYAFIVPLFLFAQVPSYPASALIRSIPIDESHTFIITKKVKPATADQASLTRITAPLPAGMRRGSALQVESDNIAIEVQGNKKEVVLDSIDQQAITDSGTIEGIYDGNHFLFMDFHSEGGTVHYIYAVHGMIHLVVLTKIDGDYQKINESLMPYRASLGIPKFYSTVMYGLVLVFHGRQLLLFREDDSGQIKEVAELAHGLKANELAP